jgi:hypothetical protein
MCLAVQKLREKTSSMVVRDHSRRSTTEIFTAKGRQHRSRGSGPILVRGCLHAQHSAGISRHHNRKRRLERELIPSKQAYPLRAGGGHSAHFTVFEGVTVVTPSFQSSSDILGPEDAIQAQEFAQRTNLLGWSSIDQTQATLPTQCPQYSLHIRGQAHKTVFPNRGTNKIHRV